MSAHFASHAPRVLSVFEIIGAYFTDTVFNHIFHGAKTNLPGGTSLADEYVRRVQAYVLGVKNDAECYDGVVQGVHAYFTGTTRFTTLSFAEFVDRIVGVCVPEDYFRRLSPQDKDELLSSVLCDLISNLAAFATTPDMLRRIVDGHAEAPEATIRKLQDAAVDALATKRGVLHNKFLRKMGQARDTVPMEVVGDMKTALRRLVKEKAEATAALGAAMQQLREGRLREAKLRKLVELLRRGRDEGAAAVGTSLRAPRRDSIAEADPLDDPPPRDRKPASRPRPGPGPGPESGPAPGPGPGAPTGFFKTDAGPAPGPEPGAPTGFFKTDAGPVTAALLRPAGKPAQPQEPRPKSLLLDAAVDKPDANNELVSERDAESGS